jgi:hypothetical protein
VTSKGEDRGSRQSEPRSLNEAREKRKRTGLGRREGEEVGRGEEEEREERALSDVARTAGAD